MDAQFWLNVVVRWIHVSSAVVGVGGIAFLGLVLLPAARRGGTEGAQAALEAALPGFRQMLHVVIALLLLTGFYNLSVVVPKANGLGDLKSTYHQVLGMKILMAFVLFGTASVVAAAARRPGGFQPRHAQMLSLSLALAAVVLFLSATLRRTWDLDPRLHTPAVASPGVPESESR
jgi:putative copper export protein